MCTVYYTKFLNSELKQTHFEIWICVQPVSNVSIFFNSYSSILFRPKKSIKNLSLFCTRAQLCKIFCKRTSQHKGIQEKCWAFKHIVNRCHGWKFVRKSMKAAASSCRPNTETNVQLCKWQIPRRKRECWTTTTTHSDFKTIVTFLHFFAQKVVFCWTHQKWSKCIT